MKCIVVGAGAWGLPAAAEMARRGHDVTLVDRHGPFNALSSSVGPTRLWRLADPNPARVRLARRGLEAMRRLADRANTEVFLTRGLVWRDDVSVPALLETLAAQDVQHIEVTAEDVGRFFPGLRPDGRDAVWQPAAGVVLAETSLRAQLLLLQKRGGATLFGHDVVDVDARTPGVRISFSDGRFIDADVAVLAPGPGAATLLSRVGVHVDLHPYLEQVVHFGDAADPHSSDALPGLFDGPTDRRPGVYGMPTPGRGYKIGLDTPLRDYQRSDEDRVPDPARTRAIRDFVCEGLASVPSTVVDEQVCVWTDSPDGSFVVDRLPEGVVFACGDSGEGFKYSALMGEVLADLAEGDAPDDDVAALSLERFAGGVPVRRGPHVMGRH
ncbi:FAD-dependent oxidoreductase [Mycobacterium hodleri]|uniref:FAD-dependent oxidoreductase n=1 Tax=Mycolicibacterium hodleri TaxID=49897 RepID=A0A544VUP9_9MYCO|nr:FAD-dependent oxidoreductase [Mycolicibacterium hodleri]TQR83714.1 FAD-dependent oxidoreductase [Mycolicibacterium hodleri]